MLSYFFASGDQKKNLSYFRACRSVGKVFLSTGMSFLSAGTTFLSARLSFLGAGMLFLSAKRFLLNALGLFRMVVAVFQCLLDAAAGMRTEEGLRSTADVNDLFLRSWLSNSS